MRAKSEFSITNVEFYARVVAKTWRSAFAGFRRKTAMVLAMISLAIHPMVVND
jgi:hypothetical protein